MSVHMPDTAAPPRWSRRIDLCSDGIRGRPGGGSASRQSGRDSLARHKRGKSIRDSLSTASQYWALRTPRESKGIEQMA